MLSLFMTPKRKTYPCLFSLVVNESQSRALGTRLRLTEMMAQKQHWINPCNACFQYWRKTGKKMQERQSWAPTKTWNSKRIARTSGGVLFIKHTRTSLLIPKIFSVPHPKMPPSPPFLCLSYSFNKIFLIPLPPPICSEKGGLQPGSYKPASL